MGAVWKEETVWVENGRQENLQLHPNGFELVPDDDMNEEIDFLNKDSVLDHYYPHCERLLERCLGQGVTVKAFDHNVRQQVPDPNMMKPLGLVHGDYTTTSGPRRLHLLAESPKINDVWRERLGDTPLLDATVVNECVAGKRRFALINVWRSIDRNHSVQCLPLACMDAETYTRNDLRVLELHYEDRIGENFLACPTAEHKWFYFPEMEFHEALLIKQWDSFGGVAQGKKRDDAVSTMSIHSAFLDPWSPAAAPPRQSIEVRCVAIWDAET